MSDTDDGNILWRRYRDGLDNEPEPDVMTLAAYAENRLSEEEAEPVERWLARDPARLDAVLAARAASLADIVPLGRTDDIRAARSLVYQRVQALGARGLMLRTAAWGSVAAGFVVACLVGYQAGVETRGHTMAAQSSVTVDINFIATAEGLLGGDMSFADDAGEEL